MEHRIDRLRSMMRPYEGARHTVVAVSLHQGKTRFVRAGAQAVDASDAEMVFEIGSITKVFTSILLCVLIEEGKVDPQAPLSEMSEELADVPSWITPESLASHTSGLPRIHVPIWKVLIKPLPEDPYAEFSRSDLLSWLQDWRGKAPRGRHRHGYSNLGYGLLGEAMAMREGTPFVDLLAERVIVPLGLKDTTERLDQAQESRFMQPRNTKGEPVVPWTFQAMAAAGCLRSTAHDLARFSSRVIQALNSPETTLDRAICKSAEPILGLGRQGRMEPVAQCSGWLSRKYAKAGPGFLFASGGTAGSTCGIHVCAEKAAACAILSNNGVAANLWAGTRLSWSNQPKQAHACFSAA